MKVEELRRVVDLMKPGPYSHEQGLLILYGHADALCELYEATMRHHISMPQDVLEALERLKRIT